MSSPSSLLAQPMQTPGKRKFAANNPSTPKAQVGYCTTELNDFTFVKVHTAKCTICDQRNRTDQMRRCPGCTWQICKGCQEEREGQGTSVAAHGSALGRMTGSQSIVRRAPPNPPTTSTKKLDFAAAPVKKDAEPEITSEDVEMKNAVVESTNIAQVTPPSSGEKCSRDRKAKTKAPIMDSPSGDDFTPAPESPIASTPTKRRKTTMSVRPTRNLRSGSPASSHGGRAASKKPPALGSSLPPASSAIGAGRMPPLPMPSPESIADVLRAHPLMNHPSPLTNPKALPKLPEPVITIRKFIDEKASSLLHDVKLDKDQQAKLVTDMREVGRKFGNKVYKEMPQGFRVSAVKGLELQVDYLGNAQKQELTKKIHDEARRLLEEFEDEADPPAFTPGADPRPQGGSAALDGAARLARFSGYQAAGETSFPTSYERTGSRRPDAQ